MAAIKTLPLLFIILALTSCADNGPPPTLDASPVWLDQIEQRAIQDGVAPETVHKALDTFVPDPRVITLDQKQPETTISFTAYRHNIVAPGRIKKGALLMQRYADILNTIESRTGVPPQIVVALWGIESSFGQNMGDYETITSLATLAANGRRAAFFESELFAALHILDLDHKEPQDLRGSWAGAMGQCQFMPSTYLKYAVDGDGDGRRDIWNDPVDVMASIANYLSAEGWQGGIGWGREVQSGDQITPSDIGLSQTHSLSEWAAKGVTTSDDSPLPGRDVPASLLQPDGPDGPSFLAYDNIRALMRWNHSTYFALSVGLLADQIKRAAQE